MLAQRSMQRSLQRAAASRSVPHPTAPLASVLLRNSHPVRTAASQAVNQSDGGEILVQQRLRRPVSPHLGIYKPQITWYPSALNRITGATLSGALYIFGFGYLVGPMAGLHLESANIVMWMAGLSVAAKVAIKATLAYPFVFHCLNGVRHLIWDTGAMLTNPRISASGWTVVAASVVGTVALFFMF